MFCVDLFCVKFPQIKLNALSCVLSLSPSLPAAEKSKNLLELLFIVVMVGHKADDKHTFKVRPIHAIDVMVV